MKISVEEVIEHTAADRISAPKLGGQEREIYGGRKQAVEVLIHAEDPHDDIDAWRESVGRTLTVIPWEQSPVDPDEERRQLTWFLHDRDWDMGDRGSVQDYLEQRLTALGGPVSLTEDDGG